ncbi:MAG: Hachiman antiphage defense system protein HamA [Aureispira sp.]
MANSHHKFQKIPIKITAQRITNLAKRYIEMRSRVKHIEEIEQDPRFKNLGFSTDYIQEFFKKNTQPIRTSLKPVRDIYRSDLGELLLTMYFDQEYDNWGESFVIPLKNIWDREHNDMPGRGIDVTGYKKDSGTIQILLGEAKVSAEKKSPPQVSNEIYKEQIKYTNTDKSYLKRRLANYSKKLEAEDAATVTLVLMALDIKGMETIYQLVYGCCVVRDTNCFKNTDFGKMKNKQHEFSPDRINYIIPVFDQPIKNVVDLFYKAVDKEINGR